MACVTLGGRTVSFAMLWRALRSKLRRYSQSQKPGPPHLNFIRLTITLKKFFYFYGNIIPFGKSSEAEGNCLRL
jgi:hypothetical protein